MKYSEFNHDWSDMELQYSDSEVYIYRDGVMIGKVSKEYRYMMSTHYEGFELLPLPVAVKLFADMAMLSETPLTEREEEKKYYLRLVTPPILKKQVTEYLRKSEYLEYYTTGLSKNTGDEKIKTIFTESEIAEMDITGFKKEPVE